MPATGDDAKALLRRDAAERRGVAAAQAPDAGEPVAGRLDKLRHDDDRWLAGAAVSAFWPMRDEIDLRPAMARLHGAGHPILLPVMKAKAAPLVFRNWWPGLDLVDGGFGTSVPPEDADEGMPAVLLVPLLAFDRSGYRLGYGGGFYDRTLAALAASRPFAVGIAYAAQEVDWVPRDAHDRRLDALVTERETLLFDGDI